MSILGSCCDHKPNDELLNIVHVKFLLTILNNIGIFFFWKTLELENVSNFPESFYVKELLRVK